MIYRLIHDVKAQDTVEQFYSDEELNEFYQNLLLSESQPPQIQNEAVSRPSSPSILLPGPAYDTIQRLEGRFRDVDFNTQTRLATPLIQEMSPTPYRLPSLQSEDAGPDAQQPHRRLLRKLNRVIEKAETSFRESFPGANIAASSGASYQPPQPPIPLVLISYKEWFDLIRHSVRIDSYLLSVPRYLLTV